MKEVRKITKAETDEMWAGRRAQTGEAAARNEEKEAPMRKRGERLDVAMSLGRGAAIDEAINRGFDKNDESTLRKIDSSDGFLSECDAARRACVVLNICDSNQGRDAARKQCEKAIAACDVLLKGIVGYTPDNGTRDAVELYKYVADDLRKRLAPLEKGRPPKTALVQTAQFLVEIFNKRGLPVSVYESGEACKALRIIMASAGIRLSDQALKGALSDALPKKAKGALKHTRAKEP